MAKKKPQKGKAKAPAKAAPPQPPKDFLDMVAPTAVRFNTNSFILGGAYHCTLALRGYPSTTEELALLRHLGERSGVNLHIYTRQVSAAEEDAILHNHDIANDSLIFERMESRVKIAETDVGRKLQAQVAKKEGVPPDSIALPVEEAYAELPRAEFLARTAAYNAEVKAELEARLRGEKGEAEDEAQK